MREGRVREINGVRREGSRMSLRRYSILHYHDAGVNYFFIFFLRGRGK